MVMMKRNIRKTMKKMKKKTVMKTEMVINRTLLNDTVSTSCVMFIE